MIDLEMALAGELQEFETALVTDVREGMRQGVIAMGEFGKDQARRVSQSLGPVGMAWGYTVYPQGRRQLADNPAVVIHPRGQSAETILKAHAKGEVITANRRRNMWMPIPGSPADRPKPRGRSLVETILERVGRENVRVIPASADRPAMAVAKDASITKTGRVGRGGRARTRSGGFRKGTADVPLFYLLPEIRLDRSVDIRRAFDLTQERAPDLMIKALAKTLGRPS